MPDVVGDTWSAEAEEERDWQDVDEDDEDEFGDLQDVDAAPQSGSLDKNGYPFMVIVDRSGVHHLGVHFCSCPDSKPNHLQLLEAGIYPASQKRPETGFTFTVLDDFLIDNKECKVAALSFYSKLRRVTCNAFPNSVPVRPCICSKWLTLVTFGVPGQIPRVVKGFSSVAGSEAAKVAWFRLH
jgi:CxC2 like cysteine cluster associated with KDZ transposases